MKFPHALLALSLGLASATAAAQSPTSPAEPVPQDLHQCASAIGDVPNAIDVCTRMLSSLDPSRYVQVSGRFNGVDGDDPRTHSPDAVAIGPRAQAIGYSSLAIGDQANADAGLDGHGAVAVGAQSQTRGVSTTAVGQGAIAEDMFSTALGALAVSRKGSLAAGAGALATGHVSTAVGPTAQATGAAATALGNNARAQDEHATALGSATVAGRHALAAGTFASATGSEATAVGYASAAPHANSVALGAYTQTSASNQVAVGYRQVSQVAAGRIAPGSTDAINGGQVWALQRQLDDRWVDVDRRVESVDQRVNGLSRRLEGLGAQTAAMTSMAAAGGPHGLAVGQVAANAGVGFYGNSSAFAVGVAARVSERVNLSGGLSFGGSGTQVMGGVGVSIRLGR
ncbi:YadA-like family protein [Luteimonas fraxinea]|uniref:YadA-like family protein n=1 Tax=Luteimonas fraxinea TaxID=2901869 RepID=A0ABS8UAX8_9GAMM|nr:YadA-like family protein [Luteimonas fraxinea]MCD9096653.1 YadA-like family protein [Luteimonas fraxinea]MCD9126024.1 YadA-like family protein [Luteimonas fraxinea]